MTVDEALVKLQQEYQRKTGALGADTANALLLAHVIVGLTNKLDQIFVAREFNSHEVFIGVKPIADILNDWFKAMLPKEEECQPKLSTDLGLHTDQSLTTSLPEKQKSDWP
jgi:hypothetical protein